MQSNAKTFVFIAALFVCNITSSTTQSDGFQEIPWWHFLTTKAPTTISSTTTAARATTVFIPGLKVIDGVRCFRQSECPSPSVQRYPTLEGICNNLVDSNRGRAGRHFKRLIHPAYGGDQGSPRLASDGRPLPSARKLSNKLNREPQQRSTFATHMIPWWGQFMTHEITHTSKGMRKDGASFNCNCKSPDPKGCFNIPIDRFDTHFAKDGETCLEFDRSQAVLDENCDSSVREQMNEISSFIDASGVYGDADTDLKQLLDKNSAIGELLTGRYTDSGNNAGLPKQTQVHRDFAARMSCPLLVHKPPNEPCLIAGDKRANENTGLSSIHVLFLRLHNIIVNKLSRMNPQWDRDTLVKETRAIIAAVQQVITYKEFLPIVIGNDFMKRFDLDLMKKGHFYGYDASVDASISSAFSTAVFRFGHTTVANEISRPAPDWFTPEAENIPVKDIFFNNGPLLQPFIGGVNSILRGLARDASLLSGPKLIDGMREHLFASSISPGQDLFAINIQRGRDHGLPGYNDYREFCGMKRRIDFFDITEIPHKLRTQLSELYRHVDDIDLYIGGLAESPVPGGVVGPTFSCIIAHQFRDLKVGDRYWFENGGRFATFTSDQMDAIRQYSLARLMCETMNDLRTIQPNPMLLATVAGNERRHCQEFKPLDLSAWKLPSMNTREYSHAKSDVDLVWTPWIPCVTADGEDMSVTTTLSYALVYRPDDVCRDILGSETRHVNSITQARFHCPRGTIKGTDFQQINSGRELKWTSWVDNWTPDRTKGDDDESESKESVCKRPLAISVQTVDGVPARETGDVFESFGVIAGFICRGNHQPSGTCRDYRVRYLCEKAKAKTRKTSTKPASRRQKDPNSLVWTPWSNTDTPQTDGDKELLDNVNTKTGFCKNPLYIDARVANTHARADLSGDRLDQLNYNVGLICSNNRQDMKICQDYEVRYLCRSRDIIENEVPPMIDQQAKQFCRSFGVCC